MAQQPVAASSGRLAPQKVFVHGCDICCGCLASMLLWLLLWLPELCAGA